MARILVTDGEQRSSLAVVRSLGKASHDVHVCSASGRSIAGASKYARREHVVPDVMADPSGFASAIEGIAERHDRDLVLPLTDPSAMVLLPLEESGRSYDIPMSPAPVYETASDKAGLMELARSAGLPVPGQIVLPSADVETANRFGEEVGWPIVLKPARSIVPGDPGLLRTSVVIVDGPEACERELRAFAPAAFPILVQERIEGPGLGVFVLADSGEVRAIFAHRRIREKPPTGGVSVVRAAVPVRPDLERYTRDLMREIGWTGVAMVEFKEDSSSGTAYLMEINARFWGSLQLAVDAGVDFPRMLVELATGSDPLPSPKDYRLDIRSRWLLGDVDHVLWMLRASTARRRTHGLPSRLRALGRFLVPWTPGLRYEVLRLSDPYPFVREVRTWLRALL